MCIRDRDMADQVKAMDEEQSALEEKIRTALLALPNLPAPDVVAGGKENNQVVKVWGEKPVFPYEPKKDVYKRQIPIPDPTCPPRSSERGLQAGPRRCAYPPAWGG